MALGVVLQASGVCYSWRLHLLDGLVSGDSVETHEKIVWCFGGGFVRGVDIW